MRLARALLLCAVSLGLGWPLAASAQEALPVGPLLQKLSLKLRGKAPTPAEIAAFRGQVAADPTRFGEHYRAKVDEYLGASEFRDKIEEFHAVWWRVPTAETARLAAMLVTEDRSYLELFEKDYLFVDGVTAAAYRRSDAQTEEPLPTAPGDWRMIRLAPSEGRFRSIFSHQDLLNQYPDTPTNRNRARSSHVFKTFLCETLSPPPTDTQHLHAPLLADDDDDHANNPDCVGCHYRLDPMARFFDNWRPVRLNGVGTWFDYMRDAAGSVVIRDADGTVRSAPGRGTSDLGRILKAEPRTQLCIASKAWEFAFGNGVKMPTETEAGLAAAFAERSSFKDALRLVLGHPYFWSTEEAPALSYGDVKSDLRVCTSCHRPDGRSEPKVDMTTYPFLPDPAANHALLKRIWAAINRRPGYRPMPEPPRPQLPSDALARLREWVSAGALDDQGRTTLNDAQIREVLDD